MTTALRKTDLASGRNRPEPQPVDYSDEVTQAQFDAIKRAVAKENAKDRRRTILACARP